MATRATIVRHYSKPCSESPGISLSVLSESSDYLREGTIRQEFFPTPSLSGEGVGLRPAVIKNGTSAKWSLKDLVYVGVRQRIQGFRPLTRYTPPLALRPHSAIPANLLHVVVELDAVPIRIE